MVPVLVTLNDLEDARLFPDLPDSDPTYASLGITDHSWGIELWSSTMICRNSVKCCVNVDSDTPGFGCVIDNICMSDYLSAFHCRFSQVYTYMFESNAELTVV